MGLRHRGHAVQRRGPVAVAACGLLAVAMVDFGAHRVPGHTRPAVLAVRCAAREAVPVAVRAGPEGAAGESMRVLTCSKCP